MALNPLPSGTETLLWRRRTWTRGRRCCLGPQLAEIADAFNDGGSITLDSFIAAANARGARQRDTHKPLTRDYLSRKFAANTSKTQYQAGQVILALILALSQERAKRMAPKNVDPLWGDGLLDPLQVTLLLYGVSYAGSSPRPVPMALNSSAVHLNIACPLVDDPLAEHRLPSAVGGEVVLDFVKDQIEDKVTDGVGEVVEIPLTKKQAAQVSVCASLLLYGHKMTVTAKPNLLYHKDGVKPSVTRIDALLEFQDDYWNNYLSIDRWMLETSLTVSCLGGAWCQTSRSNGRCRTVCGSTTILIWLPRRRMTPESLRTFQNQRDAVCAIIVRASDLVAGWGTLERNMEFAKDTGNAGDAPLTVIYYRTPHYSVDTSWAGSEIRLTGTICARDKPFALKLGGPKPLWCRIPARSNLLPRTQRVEARWQREPSPWPIRNLRMIAAVVPTRSRVWPMANPRSC